jgi:Co/Zn/Cd efflux system component
MCAVFFKQGDPKKFGEAKVTWLSVLPDFLVALVPIVTTIVLMIIDFNWVLLSLMLLIILFTSAGNGFIRGSLACKYCR